jgi:hypothetical protein
MGEIIPVNFASNFPEEKPGKQKTPYSENTEAIPIDLSREGIASIVEVMSKLRLLNDFLQRVSLSQETIALRRELTSTMTFAEICNKVADSSEADWKKQPAYFRALQQELSVKLTKVIPGLKE